MFVGKCLKQNLNASKHILVIDWEGDMYQVFGT